MWDSCGWNGVPRIWPLCTAHEVQACKSLLEQQKTETKGPMYLQHGCHAGYIHGVVPFGHRERGEHISGQ